MKAMSLFLDFTYLGHEPEAKHKIERECLNQGHIPVIEYDSDLGWVFHTLYPPDGTVSRKKIAEQFAPPPQEQRDEKGLERRIVKWLRAQGYQTRQQVRCRAGYADIVTDDAVIEVEYRLSRAKLFEAVGQVLMYRNAIDSRLRAVIIAEVIDKRAPIEAAQALGVEVLEWKH